MSRVMNSADITAAGGALSSELDAVSAVADAAATNDDLIALAGDVAAVSGVANGAASAVATKAPIASPTFTGTVSGVTASMVGLGNVNNTADTAKPVSTAQQNALDLKSNLLDTYNVQSGTTYTLVASDLGKIIRCTNAAGCVVTGPNSLVAGFNCLIQQDGAAQSSFAAGSGATVGSWPAASLKTPGLNAIISVAVKSNAGTAAAYVVAGGVS